ncbi:TIM-barrel domain-containing protein [Thalassobellus suaedae]|uniref:Glycoside hydrolase family 31 protein n=1 Tax=Thalassobellus suaedae TaxID=3074124 RepID=A0ABY9XYH6_9FLAO|nr:glycoside hydrolase family 31 protein [Flavobacteriaceae bacterium HL-DH14]
MGLSGVGNWSHCMGGFEHVADPELYIRWCQFGLLSPISHLFGMEHPNYKEPWAYGDEALRIFKQYDKMRYSLIPYLYSYSYEMYKKGTPLMRALVLSHQNDINVYNITDQYMLGESFMVCPVTEKGAQTRMVYLPKGEWTDYWTGKIFEGKQHYNVLCPIDQVPIFIKEGAIIPSQVPINYIGEKIINQLTLDIYPNKSNTFTLYNDDGKSLEYQNGDFNTTTIFTEVSEKDISLKINATKGKFKGNELTYIVNFHLSKKPSSIILNDKMHLIDNNKSVFYKNGILSVSPNLTNKKNIKILINK